MAMKNKFKFKDVDGDIFTAQKTLNAIGEEVYIVSWVDDGVSHNMLFEVFGVEILLGDGTWVML